MKTLEIGNYIYARNYYLRRYQITRVTEKTAWAGKIRVPRCFNDDMAISAIGSTDRYWCETPELNRQFRRQELIDDVKCFFREKTDNLTDDQLERISGIIKEAA